MWIVAVDFQNKMAPLVGQAVKLLLASLCIMYILMVSVLILGRSNLHTSYHYPEGSGHGDNIHIGSADDLYERDQNNGDLRAKYVHTRENTTGLMMHRNESTILRSANLHSGIIQLGRGDMNAFSYNINQAQACRYEDAQISKQILIMVHSHCSNRPQRNAIRETWANYGRDRTWARDGRVGPLYNLWHTSLGYVFLLGQCMFDHDQERVDHEAMMHKDIIQVNVTDKYASLSLKSASGLAWFERYCLNYLYMAKADDDVFLNLTRLLKLMKTKSASSATNDITCFVYYNSRVMRSGAWAVSHEHYPGVTFPPYCSGTLYIISRRGVHRLTKAFQGSPQPIIPVEDAYITGILAKESNLTHYHALSFPSWISVPSFSNIQKFYSGDIIGIHGIIFDRMYQIQKILTTCGNCGTNNTAMRKWFDWMKKQKPLSL